MRNKTKSQDTHSPSSCAELHSQILYLLPSVAQWYREWRLQTVHHMLSLCSFLLTLFFCSSPPLTSAVRVLPTGSSSLIAVQTPSMGCRPSGTGCSTHGVTANLLQHGSPSLQGSTGVLSFSKNQFQLSFSQPFTYNFLITHTAPGTSIAKVSNLTSKYK